MELKINIPLKDKNKLMIKMLNPIIGNLTNKEVDLVLAMLSHEVYVLDKDSRNEIRMFLDMDKFNFNNYIRKLKEKKILIIKDDYLLEINPRIKNILKYESLNVSFV